MPGIGPRPRSTTIMAVVLGLAATGCAPPRPNIVLVSIDTLRADAVYGKSNRRAETPVLDGLAERGVRFEYAYAPSSWTAPSMATLVSGMHPITHGVTKGSPKAFNQKILHGRIVTWAEALKEAGYRTHAVVTNGHLLADLGFDQGFDTYRHLGWEGNGNVVTRSLLDHKEEIAGSGEPWFVWLHYYDPHLSYLWRYPFAKSESIQKLAEKCAGYRGNVGRVTSRRPNWTVCARAGYLSEVAATDAAIGQALDGLGVRDRDLVVVAADHGEEFREHGGKEHGFTLYEEVTRVPLIIAFPNRWHAGNVVESPVGLVDVLPSVLEYLGIKPSHLYQGKSFLGLVTGEGEQRPLILAVDRFRRVIGIVDGRWKLLKIGDKNRRFELYDLANDPHERKNLYAERREIGDRLDEILIDSYQEMKRRRFKKLETRDFDRDEVKMLKAMGYIE